MVEILRPLRRLSHFSIVHVFKHLGKCSCNSVETNRTSDIFIEL